MQNILISFFVSGFLTTAVSHLAFAAQHVVPQSQSEDVILGPILLGEIYDKMGDQTVAELPYSHLSKEWSIDNQAHQALVKAMNKCKILIVQRVKHENKEKVFDGNPMAVMHGTFVFECTNSKRETLIICVKSIKFISGIIYGRSSGPDIYSSNLSVDFLVTRIRKERLLHQSEYSFGSEEVRWTVDELLNPKKSLGEKKMGTSKKCGGQGVNGTFTAPRMLRKEKAM